jgi:hypothetical protein
MREPSTIVGEISPLRNYLVFERPPRNGCPTMFLTVQNVSGSTPAFARRSAKTQAGAQISLKFRRSGSARTSVRTAQAFIFYDSFYRMRWINSHVR